MRADACSNVADHADAAAYSYDDPGCHPPGSLLIGGANTLVIVRDLTQIIAADVLDTAKVNNFHATLFCENDSGTLILAFRGAVSLTRLLGNRDAVLNDWVFTNVVQHLGDRPTQFRLARESAEAIRLDLDRGAFDGQCGSRRQRPLLVLTGHSKGGGQAQYAAIQAQMDAVVFNADMINPVLTNDWLHRQDIAPDWAMRSMRIATSILGCTQNMRSQPFFAKAERFFATRRVRDVRMTNDPLTAVISYVCGNNLPHASIDWLFDTSDCSTTDGHGIMTVVRELRFCPR
jgi:hypothetical protein